MKLAAISILCPIWLVLLVLGIGRDDQASGSVKGLTFGLLILLIIFDCF